MQKKISVIIPVYNVEQFLNECMESVCAQTYSNLEIIMIDDGSTDGSSALCDNWAKKDLRVKVIHQNNQGVVKARYEGIKIAQGEYLSFVDGDDWLESNMLEIMINNIYDAELISVGVLNEHYLDYTNGVCDDFAENVYEGDGLNDFIDHMIYDFDSNTNRRFTPWMWNKLYKTDLVNKIYPLIDASINIFEDSLFLYCYVMNCKKIVIKHNELYHYRFREDSATLKKNSEILETISLYYKFLKNYFSKYNNPSLIRQLEKRVIYLINEAVNSYMGFDEMNKLVQYVYIGTPLVDKKVILYGAGKVGTDYWIQLKKQGINVVSWVDKRFEQFRYSTFNIVSPKIINDIDYDVILICVENEKVKFKIEEDLLFHGIEKSRIVWSKPYKTF